MGEGRIIVFQTRSQNQITGISRVTWQRRAVTRLAAFSSTDSPFSAEPFLAKSACSCRWDTARGISLLRDSVS